MSALAAETLPPVDTALAVTLAVLLLVAAAVTARFRLSPDDSRGRAREIVTAGARAAVQLTAVSQVIGWAVRHTAALLGFLFLRFAVAARTAGRGSPRTAPGGGPPCRSRPPWQP